MIVLAALLAGLAGLLMVAGSTPGHGPPEWDRPRGPTRPGPSGWDPSVDDPGPTARTARLACAGAGVAAWQLLGGPIGLVAGLGLALLLPLVLVGMESTAQRRRRVALVRTAPMVADLLSAALVAGVPLEVALPVVADAVGGPTGDALWAVQRRIDLGQSTAQAWLILADQPGVGGIARTVGRSARTGAPLADLLARAAEDLRSDATEAALADVRAASVRTTVPVGLCLLPAFVLLGVAPVVGGLVPLP